MYHIILNIFIYCALTTFCYINKINSQKFFHEITPTENFLSTANFEQKIRFT